MSKRKLLYVVEAMGGGVFTYIVNLSNALCDKFDITIAYGMREQTPTNYRDYFDERVKLIKVENFTRSIRFEKDFKAMLEVKKIVKDIKPDVVHLHSSKAGIIGRMVVNGKKTPMFYTPHGYSFLMMDQSPIKRKLYWLIEKVASFNKCTIVACSKGEYEETLKLTKNAIAIDNGISTNEMDVVIEANSDCKVNKSQVFTIGRICEQKNPTLFNEIAKRMPDVSFVWIGDGELKDELSAENITITGWMSREGVIREAMKSGIFLLTSRWEGLPISLLEAMYLKKLCIVSNVVGNKDVIETKTNGYICDSIDEYIEAIQCSQSGRNEDLSSVAYKDVLEKYTIKVMAEKYSQAYESCF